MGNPNTATTVRVSNEETLTTDGPFAATKEALGGYCFLEADDIDAALELAAKIPAAADGRRGRGTPARDGLRPGARAEAAAGGTRRPAGRALQCGA